MRKLFNLLFPEDYSCLICSQDIFYNKYSICKNCEKHLPYLTGRLCLRCSEPLVSLGNYCKNCKSKKIIVDKAIAPFYYKDSIASLIMDLKYNNKKYTAKSMAMYMADCFNNNHLFADYIVPVPICEKRLKQRGFNQSEEIANELSKLLKMKVKTEVLKRVKETPTQTNLDYHERQVNLKDAFKAYKPKLIKDKTVLIIDDVYTTGATVTECSKELKSAGAKCVYVLTFARTELKKNN